MEYLESDTQPETLAGDVNEDGGVNILDVIALNKSLLVGAEISEQGRLNADVNASGAPDSDDALTILKFTIKLVAEF